MKWSLKLGKLPGIDVYLHFTFLLLLVFLGFYYWRATHNVEAALLGVAFIVALFGCVALHELGHALMARRYGIKTRDITLLPISGVARPEKMPEQPMQELLAGSQQDFPVLDNDQPVGILRRNDLVKALSEGRREAVVTEAMSRDCETVDEAAPLQGAVEAMHPRQYC